MGKMTSKKKKHVKRSKPKESIETWVESLCFEPVENGRQVPDGSLSFSIVSWNVLAETYCSRKSHTHLPAAYAEVVFDKSRRRSLVVRTLKRFVEDLDVDIICLQEVDVDEVGKQMCHLGYKFVETPRARGGGSAKVDSCGVYVKSDTFSIVEHKLIHFDDLATRSSPNETFASGEPENLEAVVKNLQGLQQSFLRRNAGVLVRLQHVQSRNTIVVANAHLFWNPMFEFVKLCQAHYLAQCAKSFCNENESFVLCGDLNSKPNGVTHSYLSRGCINAKRMAPWYNPQLDPDENILLDSSDEETRTIVDKMAELRVSEANLSPDVRYLLDATLNKLCRWLRILGIDAALETEEEERLRTEAGDMLIFVRCRSEGRTLVTSSTRLMQRRDCPAGAYCINPVFLKNLEVTLVHMLLTHGVILKPKNFLSRCVVCNGNILPVTGQVEKTRVLENYQAPIEFVETMDVYECNCCGQGYWWCDRPTSSASRVKDAATRLLSLCIRAGIPLADRLDSFWNIDEEEEKGKGWDSTMERSNLLAFELDVVKWMRQERLCCPFQFESAYAAFDERGKLIGERIPFSNVTYSFVDTLDYIFFEKGSLSLQERLYVPSSFDELSGHKGQRGHLLPSNVWPSDHLAVGARLYVREDSGHEKFSEVTRDTTFCTPLSESPTGLELPPGGVHKVLCECGCVPRVPSLFEMAERRRKAKLLTQKGTDH